MKDYTKFLFCSKFPLRNSLMGSSTLSSTLQRMNNGHTRNKLRFSSHNEKGKWIFKWKFDENSNRQWPSLLISCERKRSFVFWFAIFTRFLLKYPFLVVIFAWMETLHWFFRSLRGRVYCKRYNCPLTHRGSLRKRVEEKRFRALLHVRYRFSVSLQNPDKQTWSCVWLTQNFSTLLIVRICPFNVWLISPFF